MWDVSNVFFSTRTVSQLVVSLTVVWTHHYPEQRRGDFYRETYFSKVCPHNGDVGIRYYSVYYTVIYMRIRLPC